MFPRTSTPPVQKPSSARLPAAAEQNHHVNSQDLVQYVPGKARQLHQPCAHTRSHHQGLDWLEMFCQSS